ncbi:hypothetical protein [Cellulomonas alba]|uniref:Uncharacterized protein n=1 Tax=Cellulomonas alba TaxID=3053467 RepID=A0ABT7SF90_9CELL|nr:hypothetical protein [Cellulomonas alba]MDM7854855.1 hypothetical protein [Cellulomonas alba]
MTSQDDEAGAAAVAPGADAGSAAPGARDDARATTPAAPDDTRQRRLARIVTCAVVGVIVLGALAEVEAWPVTAFRLFSQVRTDTSTSLQLVVVHPDGSSAPLLLKPANDVVVITGHQFATLRDLPASKQRAKVDAWLDLAGIDPADVASVRLDRVTFRWDDATGRWAETKRTEVTEVTP